MLAASLILVVPLCEQIYLFSKSAKEHEIEFSVRFLVLGDEIIYTKIMRKIG